MRLGDLQKKIETLAGDNPISLRAHSPHRGRWFAYASRGQQRLSAAGASLDAAVLAVVAKLAGT